MLNHKR